MAKEKCWTPLQRELRSRWQRVIEMQADSSMEIKEFCVMEKIPISTFYKWRHKLQRYGEAKMHELSPEFSAFMDSPPVFAAVAVIEDGAGQGLAGDEFGVIEIILPNGVQVRVTSAHGVVGLAGVLDAVEGFGAGGGVAAGARC